MRVVATTGAGIPPVEPRVRRVVADCLGVAAAGLSGRVLLREDIAADSLDLIDLAIALEAEFRIVVPDAVLAEVRTYDDLVDAIEALLCAARKTDAEREHLRVVVRSLLMPPASKPGGVLARVDRLTPYAGEILTEDARRMGRGARLEATVVAEAGDAGVAYAQRVLGGLRKWGVLLHVAREGAADVTKGEGPGG